MSKSKYAISAKDLKEVVKDGIGGAGALYFWRGPKHAMNNILTTAAGDAAYIYVVRTPLITKYCEKMGVAVPASQTDVDRLNMDDATIDVVAVDAFAKFIAMSGADAVYELIMGRNITMRKATDYLVASVGATAVTKSINYIDAALGGALMLN